MTQLSQVQAVVNATKFILADEYRPGEDIKAYISKDQQDAVVDEVARGILSGEVVFSVEARAKYDTDAKVHSYVVGMVNNHFRKCKELNGGVKHSVANPGSRAGSSDPQVKALRAMKATLEDKNASPEALAKVDEAINKRLSEIKATSKALPKINFSALSPELADLIKTQLVEAGINPEDVAA